MKCDITEYEAELPQNGESDGLREESDSEKKSCLMQRQRSLLALGSNLCPSFRQLPTAIS